MVRLASPNQQREDLRLALFMQLRPSASATNSELATLARDREAAKDPRNEEREPRQKPGEFKIVPVTTTTVEGIGTMSNVHYSIITYEVTSAGVSMEKRPVWGQNMSGVMTFNE